MAEPFRCAGHFSAFGGIELKQYSQEVKKENICGKMPHVADYAYMWLVFGKGAKTCGNDFGIFMSSLMFAGQMWLNNPQSIFCKELGDPKPPTAFMAYEGCGYCECSMDPQFFKRLVADPECIRRTIAELE